MDIIKALDDYRQVADYLQDCTTLALLDKMKNQMVHKEYLLPVIGQFSAGKSKLINRLIGAEILPTKRVETTAFLTYIKYGESRTAALEYAGGLVKKIPMEEVKKLDYQATVNSAPISALHVTMPLDILKGGLTIVDTPGVNTLIEEHFELTEDLLFNSQFIIYVLGGSPSESDLNMLRRIEDLGISIIFARTQIDLVKIEEEDVQKTITGEKQSIETFLGHTVLFIPLCNDETSDAFGEWKKYFTQFLYILSESVADDIESVYENKVLERLRIIRNNFIKTLENKRKIIIQSKEKNASEIEAEIKAVNDSRSKLNHQLDSKLEELNRDAQNVGNRIERIVQAKGNEAYAKFSEGVEKLSKESFRKDVAAYYETELPVVTREMGEQAGKEIQKWTAEHIENIQSNLQQINADLDSVDLSFQTDFCLDIAREYAEKESVLSDDLGLKICQLEDLITKSEEEMRKLGLEKRQIEEELQKYRSAISEGENGLAAIREAYEPKYIIKEGRLGPIMEKIGQGADIAMLFIPAAGWSKAGSMLAKGAGKLAKGGRLAQQAAKALESMSKGAEILSKTDKVMDASKFVKGGIDAIQRGKLSEYQEQIQADAEAIRQTRIEELEKKRKSSSIFDYVSLSYWFQKIGDAIDPTTTELDMEFQKRHEEEMARLQQEQNELIRSKVETERRRRQNMTAQERILIETQVREDAEIKYKRKIEEAKATLEKEKEIRIYSALLESAKKQYREKLNGYSDVLMGNVQELIKSIAPMIVSSATQYVESQLSMIETQLKDIKKRKEDSGDEFDSAIIVIDDKIKLMQLPDE